MIGEKSLQILLVSSLGLLNPVDAQLAFTGEPSSTARKAPSPCFGASIELGSIGTQQPGETIWLTLRLSAPECEATADIWIDLDRDGSYDPGPEHVLRATALERGFGAFEWHQILDETSRGPFSVSLVATPIDGSPPISKQVAWPLGSATECAWVEGYSTPDFNDSVHAFAVHDDGSGPALFAGGSFTVAGSAVAAGIAKWDGTSWSALIGASGSVLEGVVNALEVWNDGSGPALFAAGQFSLTGFPETGNIARWDGMDWSILEGASGVGLSLSANALAVFDEGGGSSLFVGGRFAQAGGIPVLRVARWDGSEWSALDGPTGMGVDGEVRALTSFDDGEGPKLVVGGDFETAGGVTVHHIAGWDGSTWSALAGPSGSGTSAPVHSLQTWDDGGGTDLYVGGSFPLAGGVTVHSVARWDGTLWSELSGSEGTGVGGTALSIVHALGVYGQDLYVGGKFATAGGLQANRIARWDGSEWWQMSGVGGGGTGTNGIVRAVRAFHDGDEAKLFVGGDFSRAGGLEVNYVATWEAWQSGWIWKALDPGIALGLTGVARAFEVFDDGRGPALYVGGAFEKAGSLLTHSIARWDGRNWQALDEPWDIGISTDNDDSFESVSALEVYDDGSGPVLVVAGRFDEAGGQPVDNIALWTGEFFLPLTGGGIQGAISYGVHALAVADLGSGPMLFAGGWFDQAGDVPVSNLAVWDGTTWSALEAPAGEGTNAAVNALVSFDDGSGVALFAGGTFTSAGGVPCAGAAKWDGSHWSPLVGPSSAGPGPTDALVVWDDGGGPALYAGGNFTTSGGIQTNRIARWDGFEWSWLFTPLGIGVDDRVRSLAVIDDGRDEALFVGGDFFVAGHLPARRIARWDGSAWSILDSPLAAGTENDVLALGSFDRGTGPELYAGGPFETAGGIASKGIAQWSCRPTPWIFEDGFEDGDTTSWSATEP